MENTIREQINNVIKKYSFNKDELIEVNKLYWKTIIDKFEAEFIRKSHYKNKVYWYWDLFENDYGIQFEEYDAFKILNNLIDEKEKIWFLVEEKRQVPKFWIYEGTIKSIQKAIEESVAFEYYIVSKKFSWVLCENHHGYLIASGDYMIEKLRNYEKSY